MITVSASLNQNFYQWEKRGRGWTVWDGPVELEPPFTPFVHSYNGRFAPPIDDGRSPTRVGSWLEKLKNRLTGAVENTAYNENSVISEPDPGYFVERSPLVEIAISVPPDYAIVKQTAEQFILSLTAIRLPVSFEVIGTQRSIVFQLACRELDAPRVRQQLKAYFPEAVFSINENPLREIWVEEAESIVIDFGLSNEFMRPLREFRSFDVDPLIGIIGALSNLEPREVGILQVLFQPARNSWAESIMRSVTGFQGESFFADAPEMVGLAKEKIERPLFAAVIRIASLSSNFERTRDIAISMGGVLAQFSRPGSNELIPLDNEDYDDFCHEEDLLLRQSRRSGVLLNTSELASLIHLPSASVRSEKLSRETRRTKAAPVITLDHSLLLGENTHQGKTIAVTVSAEQRLKHTHVIGATGTGKSTLLLNSIIQDIEAGEGLGVIDPHGDLIDQILGYIPDKRFDEVVLFDPADTEFPIGFNILSTHSELEKNILASDLAAVFRRLSTSWGDQMTSVLGNAILAFLESEKGGTLLDLRRFLIDPVFRKLFLESVKDPEVIYFWQKEFPLLTGRPQAPVLTRLDTFLRPKIIRNMVGQKHNKIDFENILNKRKILLVKLAQGLIGEENTYLLGAFIVSKLHQIVMGRQELGERERENFWLYIDEFQNFVTPSMAAILSGARKYHLGLILSHQDLEQLSRRDSEVASSVISNPATRVCFRLGDFDARKLQEGFSYFSAEDLQNLSVGEAICRIERADYDFNLRTAGLSQMDPKLALQRRQHLVALSREKYASGRKKVEDNLFEPKVTTDAADIKAGDSNGQRSSKWDATNITVNGESSRMARDETTHRNPISLGLSKVKTDTRSRDQTQRREIGPVSPESASADRFNKADNTDAQTIQSSPGRGGQQHKRLQSALRHLGQSKSYLASIEKPMLGGTGSVDVVLERNNVSIACEISVTTDLQHELENLHKCLAAGFDHVVMISGSARTLNLAKKVAIGSISDADFARVQFLLFEQFSAFLETLDAGIASTEKAIRGYKVKTKYTPVSESEKKARKKIITQTILQALRKAKEKQDAHQNRRRFD